MAIIAFWFRKMYAPNCKDPKVLLLMNKKCGSIILMSFIKVEKAGSVKDIDTRKLSMQMNQ